MNSISGNNCHGPKNDSSIEDLVEAEKQYDETMQQHEAAETDLDEEFEQRMFELAEWADELEEGTEESTNLIGLIENGLRISFMYDLREQESGVTELMKKSLYVVKSLLLFNKRQKVEPADALSI